MTDARTDTPTVLITGAARRVGKAIALDFAAQGCNVAVHYGGSADEAAAVVAEIERLGARAVALQADLAQAQAVRALIPDCAAALGAPTCLINNASLFAPDTIRTLDDASWESHLAVNLRAPVLLAQAFAAALPAGTQGNIVNIIDQRVWKLTPEFFSYTASKAGLWTVTRTMAQALAPDIRVNGIGPGPTLASRHQDAATFERQKAAVPLGRGPTLDEICRAIRFILETPSMTGQMIALDGGQHLSWQTPDAKEDL